MLPSSLPNPLYLALVPISAAHPGGAFRGKRVADSGCMWAASWTHGTPFFDQVRQVPVQVSEHLVGVNVSVRPFARALLMGDVAFHDALRKRHEIRHHRFRRGLLLRSLRGGFRGAGHANHALAAGIAAWKRSDDAYLAVNLLVASPLVVREHRGICSRSSLSRCFAHTVYAVLTAEQV